MMAGGGVGEGMAATTALELFAPEVAAALGIGASGSVPLAAALPPMAGAGVGLGGGAGVGALGATGTVGFPGTALAGTSFLPMESLTSTALSGTPGASEGALGITNAADEIFSHLLMPETMSFAGEPILPGMAMTGVSSASTPFDYLLAGKALGNAQNLLNQNQHGQSPSLSDSGGGQTGGGKLPHLGDEEKKALIELLMRRYGLGAGVNPILRGL